MLTLIPARGGPPRALEALGTRVVVAERVDCPDDFALRETLLVRGDFQCGSGCRFEGPVYVGGNCVVGKGSRIGAVCAEGGLVLGLGARVEHWADALGLMDLRAGAWAGEAISETGIQIAQDAGAGMALAPAIRSQGGMPGIADATMVRSLLEIPRPASGELPELGGVRGFQEEKLSALGAETWVYDGSLALPMPVYVRSKLVVRGSFSCPAGSLIEDDVKCGGTMRIGRGSVVRARLTARGEMTLEADCLFEGELEAGISLRLSSGVRGIRSTASARERVLLEPDVVVRGRLAGGVGVAGVQPLVEGGLDLLLCATEAAPAR